MSAGRQRALSLLNAVVFLMSFGFFMLFPLLANHLISWQKIAVVTVTFILNARLVSQDSLMLPAGLLLRKMAPHVAVALGGITRGVGFLLFAITGELPLLLLASVLAGVGGALFFPAMHALYTHYSDAETRLDAFARRERLNSVGEVLGPLLGTALVRLGFQWVGVGSALVFVVASLLLLMRMPRDEISAMARQSGRVSLRETLSGPKLRAFLVFAAASMLLMQLNNQSKLAVAVRIDQIDPTYPSIGILSSLSAVLMALLQVRALRAFAKVRPPIILMLTSALLMAGYLVIGLGSGIPAMYVGSILCCLGTMLHLPARDAMLSGYAGDGSPAPLYGFIGVLNTLGTLTLASGMGALSDISYQPAYRFTPWLALIATGAAAILALAAVMRGQSGAHTSKAEEM